MECPVIQKLPARLRRKLAGIGSVTDDSVDNGAIAWNPGVNWSVYGRLAVQLVISTFVRALCASGVCEPGG